MLSAYCPINVRRYVINTIVLSDFHLCFSSTLSFFHPPPTHASRLQRQTLSVQWTTTGRTAENRDINNYIVGSENSLATRLDIRTVCVVIIYNTFGTPFIRQTFAERWGPFDESTMDFYNVTRVIHAQFSFSREPLTSPNATRGVLNGSLQNYSINPLPYRATVQLISPALLFIGALLFIARRCHVFPIAVSIDCQHDRWHSCEKHSSENPGIFLRVFAIRLERTRERKRKIEGRGGEYFTRSRFAYIHANRNSVLSSEIRGRRRGTGVAGQLRRSGRVARERRGGGRGAPSYFTVITVTCYRARSLRHAINRRLPLPRSLGGSRDAKGG